MYSCMRGAHSFPSNKIQTRDALEKVIAVYIATGKRPEIMVRSREERVTFTDRIYRKVRRLMHPHASHTHVAGMDQPAANNADEPVTPSTPNSNGDDSDSDLDSELGWEMDWSLYTIMNYVEKSIAPKKFGFETVDGIDYYIELLQDLNAQVCMAN
jgi:hypothetical protein